MVFENARTYPTPEGEQMRCPPPSSTYGFQKLAGEYFAKGAYEQYGMPYTIARPFNAYGPGELPDPEPGLAHAVPDLINKVLDRQRPLQIFGSGEQTRTLTHVDDIAEGIVTAMSSPAGENQDFNISSVGLRPWTVYGVGRDLGMTSEPTKAIKAALLGRPYAISFGGWTDFQYVDDVAKAFVLCLERPYSGAKSYNLRGAVVTLADFHAALGRVLPEAATLVTTGKTQIAIAYDLADDALQRDLGLMPKTSLEDGIRETVAIFRQLQAEGRLDTADLDAPKPPPVTVAEV